MEQRFKRAFILLVNESKGWTKEEFTSVLEHGLNLMWLRNEANLWVDYVEDKDWVINGVNYDPNHPDNLSNSVFELWRDIYGS